MRSPLRRSLWIVWFAALISCCAVRAVNVVPEGVSAASGPVVVDGRPAIAWAGASGGIRYVRASGANGDAWSSPVNVDPQGWPGGRVCLAVANGNPAVAYFSGLQAMRFARARDAAGSAWNAPVSMGVATDSAEVCAMAIVDGNPAVCFVSQGLLRYLRATDAGGSSWGQPVTIGPPGVPTDPCLGIVNGRPAVAWTDYNGVWFVRAKDTSGTTWNSPVRIMTVGFYLQRYSSLQTVNGRPAIAFYDAPAKRLKYTRASDADGTAWSAPVTLRNEDAGDRCSLSVVQAKPAIAFFDGGTLPLLRFMLAKDADGASPAAWNAPVTVANTDDGGADLTFIEFGGAPVLTFRNPASGALSLLRMSNGLWPPDIRVLQNSVPLGSGATVDFGIVAAGQSRTLTFELENPLSGAAGLEITGAIVSGADAANFEVAQPLPGPIAALSSGSLNVVFRPLSSGRKSATLSLSSNAGIAANPWRILLEAGSAPRFQLERPANRILSPGTTVLFATNPAVGTYDVDFTVRNTGGGLLDAFAFELQGFDKDEFSVVRTPPPVPPGGSGVFTVRHTWVRSGNKSARLYVRSNDALNDYFPVEFELLPHSFDPDFQPKLDLFLDCAALYPDSSVLIGNYGAVQRLNTLGGPFPWYSGASHIGDVTCIAVQDDGKVLVGADWTDVANNLARVQADGTSDTAFDPGVGGRVNAIALQADGKIVVAGEFETVGGTTQRRIARLFPDGALDTGFHPPVPDSGSIHAVSVQKDGKILLGGDFHSLSGTPVPPLVRLLPDGTLDAFPVVLSQSQSVYALAVIEDGSIWAGTSNSVTRFLRDGTAAAATPVNVTGGIRRVCPQVDGNVIFSGNFTVAGGAARPGIARIHPDGALDLSFRPENFESTYYILPQGDGKVIIYAGVLEYIGEFFVLLHKNLYRLNNDPATVELSHEGRSSVRWLRGGTAPSVSRVTFEVKTADSQAWTFLGDGTLIAGGWELSGLSLPAAGTLRARGRVDGSLVESTAPVTTPLGAWRMQYFNSAADTGPPADNADPDNDGLTNFTEFAFGLDPTDRSSSVLPAFLHNGTSFAASFTVPEGREDLNYSAEWSATMKSGTWTTIPDTGGGNTHEFSVLGGGEKVFVRFLLHVK